MIKIHDARRVVVIVVCVIAVVSVIRLIGGQARAAVVCKADRRAGPVAVGKVGKQILGNIVKVTVRESTDAAS